MHFVVVVIVKILIEEITGRKSLCLRYGLNNSWVSWASKPYASQVLYLCVLQKSTALLVSNGELH